MVETILKKDAKDQGLKYYFTGIPCKHGHTSKRYVSDGSCCECNNTRKRQYYANNKRSCLKRGRVWQDQIRATNPEIIRTYNNRWYNKRVATNPDYRSVKAGRAAKYRAAKLQATPPWFTSERQDIDNLYHWCHILTQQTGAEHHVDHIIPLQNKHVCGLHCFANLQILTAEDNDRKGNTFDNS